jgi:hypothetical protein
MANDPYAYAYVSSNGPMYVGKVYAAKDTDQWSIVKYDHDDLRYFTFDYADKEAVDNALMRMCDPSLVAEVHRYRCLAKRILTLHKKLKKIEGELFTVGNRRTTCICRLQEANAKDRIEQERDKDADVRVVIPWEHIRDHMDK